MIRMGKEYSRIVQRARSLHWAILESKLCSITEVLWLRSQGLSFDDDEIRERLDGFRADSREREYQREIAAQEQSQGRSANQVAVIPMMGVISYRMDMFSEMSGGASIDRLRRNFRNAMENPKVGTVVLDIDSPGGSVEGTMEFADEIFQARKEKRIIAVADTMAASGAYWLGSAASEFVVSPSGEVGSVGVFAIHDDFSQALEMEGIKTTLVKAGKFKAELAPEFPLTEEARDHLQSQVDVFYDAFVKDLARNRRTSQTNVRQNFGEGRTVLAKDALKAGMVDRIGTFDEALEFAMSGKSLRSVEAEQTPVADDDMRRRLEMAALGA